MTSLGLTRAELRAEVDELIRNAYAGGWRESKRWPNRKNPPQIEIDWTQPGGVRISEIWEDGDASSGDVMAVAAHRHRWVMEYRRLCDSEGRRLPFERVRTESFESAKRGEELTDEQIAERVRAAVGLEAQ